MSRSKNILVRSLELFQARGIKTVTMDDVAQEMGLSKKTIYLHFSSKKELVQKCIHYLFDLHFSNINRIQDEGGTSIEKIKKIYEYAVNHLIKVAPNFYFDLKRGYPETYRFYALQRRKIVFGIIKDLLQKGQANGDIDPTIHTQLFCEFHLINLDQLISSKTSLMEYSLQDLLDNTIRVSLNGISKRQ
ncbi:MAG: hypothetical protein CMP05_10715 [Xanthomarina sp.]|uniref:TetR/AcrR family transcriptional regulator n=1 Tax=Xanthomarina sp. TaxID=1931211 RepID=UPI000C3A2737|nr:TetR/AcrR family transcriptional regulator [Xanthomarina sp.]MAL23005.1 hypothetical protein [Xanthomarina sp.]MBF62456.1 hypothetical protein [Xanthomarina sp.]HAI18540.1 hypothetical protein [Xanthomarina gelatinilytica]|tara:strand:+ start:1393 stop:1959 length:567 start_codon:yes stop_codon:yes gene_type:complete